MDFINKYVKDRKNDHIFKWKKEPDKKFLFKTSSYFELTREMKFIYFIVFVSIVYICLSYLHTTQIEILPKISEIYFLHYRAMAGFFPPLVFIFLYIISIIILMVFSLLILIYRCKLKKIYDIWITTQLIANELFIIWLSYNTISNLKYPIWGFFDALICWNLFVLIFVPFLTLLLLIKIFIR